MTTEILKRRSRTAITFIYDCKGCGSTLRSSREDGVLVSDPRDGDAYKITCPACHTQNWVAASLFKD